MSYDTKHLQQSEAWAFFSYVYVLMLVFEPSAAFDLSIHHFYSIIHVTYDMYTELYLVYLATTRFDPHLISDLPYIFVAQIYHGVTQLLQICHPSWEFSIPSHPIPEVLNWIQMWWLWRPFECSELTVGRLWLRSSTNRKVRSLAA